MSFTSGDILEITYNHSILGSGTIYCKANESGTIDRGGFRTNDDTNQITGDGRMIRQINRVRASFEMPIAWDMTVQDELKTLSDLAASPVLANWTINHANGSIWGGKGCPVGDLQGDTNTSLTTLKLAFEGELRKLV